MIPLEDPRNLRTVPPWRHHPVIEGQNELDSLTGDVGGALDALWTEYVAQGLDPNASPRHADLKSFLTNWVSNYLGGK